MYGILFNRLHLIVNLPGEFASKLDVLLTHFLKIVQEVGLEKVTYITTFKPFPGESTWFEVVELLLSGHLLALKWTLFFTYVSNGFIFISPNNGITWQNICLCGDIPPLKFHLKIKEDLVEFRN